MVLSLPGYTRLFIIDTDTGDIKWAEAGFQAQVADSSVPALPHPSSPAASLRLLFSSLIYFYTPPWRLSSSGESKRKERVSSIETSYQERAFRILDSNKRNLASFLFLFVSFQRRKHSCPKMSLPNAFVTLLTTSSYLPGALVLLHALHDLHPAPRDFQIVALVTPETVDAATIGELRRAGYDLVIGVEPIGSGKAGQVGLELMGRPDLNFALTKLHLFRLAPFFSTLIYLDADILPLRPISHLFTSTAPHVFSACPDTGWPDCFNSGFMVIRPRESDWDGLKGMLKDGEGEDGLYREAGNGSFDGADQGLLNEWFSEEGGGGDWNRLSFTYNVTPSAAYTWAPAYKRFGHKISNVHFIGPNKPWTSLPGRPAGVSNVKGKENSYDYLSLIDRWFAVYDKHVRPASALDPDISRRFAVPQTIAAWDSHANQARAAATVLPEDKLDLSELKAATERGVNAFKPGQYTSLPLEGRVDLIMPKPKPIPRAPISQLVASSTIAPSVSPSALTPPPADAAPAPAPAPVPTQTEQKTAQPSVWDAQRSSPPASAPPEMSVPHAYYHNAWEAPLSQQSSYYAHPESHRPATEHKEPEYPTLPKEVTGDSWYARFATSTPDKRAISAVFPWEEKSYGPGYGHGSRPKPERVFPKGEEPLPSLVQQLIHPLQPPSISIQNPTPPHPAHSQHQSHATGMGIGMAGQAPKSPSPPPRHVSMVEAMASYKNVWDDIPQIGRYVDIMSGKTGGRSVRGVSTRGHGHGHGHIPGHGQGQKQPQAQTHERNTSLHSLQSVPGTPRTQYSTFGKSPRLTNARNLERRESFEQPEDSADGDDENSTSASEEEGGKSREGNSSKPYKGNKKYKDRWAQTDRVKTVDETVQTQTHAGEEAAAGGLKMWGLPHASAHGRKSSKEIPFPSGSGNGRAGGGGQREAQTQQQSTYYEYQQQHPHSQQSRQGSMASPKPELNVRLPDYSFDFKGATSHAQGLAQTQAQAQGQPQGQGANPNLNAQHRHRPSGSFSTIYGGRGRVWDPNTDVEVRRRDSQEVLARFMQGSLGRG
ncbi:glycogenin glucosyltransferase [Cryptococcus neoformans Tu401-1]|nr:glycogenin glucosyltransferase [Cryptococcus neoformans var. grubii Bt85]OXG19716.1 glycogenin glucosyltransferase [Cryptococcus neoformans var. grubii Tu401-1]OXM79831.1 glycogenin glucosyltransferase [Cryptococcus neoformans var. grubii Bt63]